MSKTTKADAAEPEVAAAEQPTMADLMALVQKLQAQVDAQAPAAPVEVDFSDAQAEAERAGFKAQVVPSLQKGAVPALRVDY